MTTIKDLNSTSLTTSFLWRNLTQQWSTPWTLEETANFTADPPMEHDRTNQTTALYVPAWLGVPLLAVAVLGVVGNLAVVVIVGFSRRLHMPFYLVLMSLATCDLLKAFTVGPLAILRVILGGTFPWWVCWLADRVYLGFVCLTLCHIIVALIHVILILYNPLCFRHLSDTCVVGMQLTVAWTFPVALSVPQLVYTVELFDITCRPQGTLDTLYFMTRVFPMLIVPILTAVVMSGLVILTINTRRKVAQRMRTHKQSINSEVSSNGMVTNENSISSEDGVLQHPSSQTPPYSTNGKVVTIQQHDIIVHDDTTGEGRSIVNGSGKEPGNHEHIPAENGMVNHGFEEDVSRSEMGDAHLTDPVFNSDVDISQIPAEESGHSKLVSMSIEHITNGDNNLKESDKSSSSSEICVQTKHAEHPNIEANHPTSVLKADSSREEPEIRNNGEVILEKASVISDEEKVAEVKRMTMGSEKVKEVEVTWEVNVVHVKTKVGKEALNEPLDTDDLHLQLASFLNSYPGLTGGVNNPAFSLENHSDTPLSDSIKPRLAPKEVQDDKASPRSILRHGAQVNTNGNSSANSSREISCASSMSGDDTVSGHRSILKCSQSIHDLKKRVKFDLPCGEELQLDSTRPRLLSCKYKTKRSNNVKGVLCLRQQRSKTQLGHVNVDTTLQGVKESLATTANIKYLAQAQWDQGTRLTACIKQQASHMRLLLAMLAVCAVCVCPYVGMLVGLSLGDPAVGWTDPAFLISGLECLGLLPFITYPVLYLILSTEFRQRLKAMFAKN